MTGCKERERNNRCCKHECNVHSRQTTPIINITQITTVLFYLINCLAAATITFTRDEGTLTGFATISRAILTALRVSPLLKYSVIIPSSGSKRQGIILPA